MSFKTPPTCNGTFNGPSGCNMSGASFGNGTQWVGQAHRNEHNKHKNNHKDNHSNHSNNNNKNRRNNDNTNCNNTNNNNNKNNNKVNNNPNQVYSDFDRNEWDLRDLTFFSGDEESGNMNESVVSMYESSDWNAQQPQDRDISPLPTSSTFNANHCNRVLSQPPQVSSVFASDSQQLYSRPEPTQRRGHMASAQYGVKRGFERSKMATKSVSNRYNKLSNQNVNKVQQRRGQQQQQQQQNGLNANTVPHTPLSQAFHGPPGPGHLTDFRPRGGAGGRVQQPYARSNVYKPSSRKPASRINPKKSPASSAKSHMSDVRRGGSSQRRAIRPNDLRQEYGGLGPRCLSNGSASNSAPKKNSKSPRKVINGNKNSGTSRNRRNSRNSSSTSSTGRRANSGTSGTIRGTSSAAPAAAGATMEDNKCGHCSQDYTWPTWTLAKRREHAARHMVVLGEFAYIDMNQLYQEVFLFKMFGFGKVIIFGSHGDDSLLKRMMPDGVDCVQIPLVPNERGNDIFDVCVDAKRIGATVARDTSNMRLCFETFCNALDAGQMVLLINNNNGCDVMKRRILGICAHFWSQLRGETLEQSEEVLQRKYCSFASAPGRGLTQENSTRVQLEKAENILKQLRRGVQVENIREDHYQSWSWLRDFRYLRCEVNKMRKMSQKIQNKPWVKELDFVHPTGAEMRQIRDEVFAAQDREQQEREERRKKRLLEKERSMYGPQGWNGRLGVQGMHAQGMGMSRNDGNDGNDGNGLESKLDDDNDVGMGANGAKGGEKQGQGWGKEGKKEVVFGMELDVEGVEGMEEMEGTEGFVERDEDWEMR